MNNSSKLHIPRILPFLMIFANALGVCTEEMQKTVAQATPYELYGIIDTTKSATFPEGSLLKNGLNHEELQKWDNLIECCHLVVTNFIENNQAPQRYAYYVAQLNETTDFIKNTINAVHKKYSLLVEENSLREKIKQLIKKDSSHEKLQYAYTLKTEISNHIKKISPIISMTLKKINEDVSTPDEWKLGIPATIDAILPCHKDFFNSYYLAKKTAPNKQLNSSELIYFLNITKIFKSKCLKNVHYSDTAKAAALVDILEKLNYRLEEDIKKSLFNKARKKMLGASKEIIQALLSHYPQMITAIYFKKLPLTQDKASIILFAEAKDLISILEELIKEIHQIITKRPQKKGVNHEK